MIYIKEVNGERLERRKNQIVIIKDNMQILNPSEELILEDGWIPKTEDVIERKIQEILAYDSSDAINICYISYKGNVLPYWANKTERNDLKDALKDCISLGRNIYRLDLRDLGISVEVECEKLLNMMSALEVYAIDCYNKTTDHIFAVQKTSNPELYDYTTGYPNKITFEL